MSGLNALTGGWVAQSSKTNGAKHYQYDSCKETKAVGAQSRLAQIPNAWVDNRIPGDDAGCSSRVGRRYVT